MVAQNNWPARFDGGKFVTPRLFIEPVNPILSIKWHIYRVNSEIFWRQKRLRNWGAEKNGQQQNGGND